VSWPARASNTETKGRLALRPVGGFPRNCPRKVWRAVPQQLTAAPSAAMPSAVTEKSGNASKNRVSWASAPLRSRDGIPSGTASSTKSSLHSESAAEVSCSLLAPA
jgi:hypothetical protein